MTIEELENAIYDGPWPDCEFLAVMRTEGDPEVEVCLHKVRIGVGWFNLVGGDPILSLDPKNGTKFEVDPDATVLFPCKFEEDPELFILVYRHRRFWFKQEECWIERMEDFPGLED